MYFYLKKYLLQHQSKRSFASTHNQRQTLWGTQHRAAQHDDTSVTSQPQSTARTTGGPQNEQT